MSCAELDQPEPGGSREEKEQPQREKFRQINAGKTGTDLMDARFMGG
jgi:hypothetical protein